MLCDHSLKLQSICRISLFEPDSRAPARPPRLTLLLCCQALHARRSSHQQRQRPRAPEGGVPGLRRHVGVPRGHAGEVEGEVPRGGGAEQQARRVAQRAAGVLPVPNVESQGRGRRAAQHLGGVHRVKRQQSVGAGTLALASLMAVQGQVRA